MDKEKFHRFHAKVTAELLEKEFKKGILEAGFKFGGNIDEFGLYEDYVNQHLAS